MLLYKYILINEEQMSAMNLLSQQFGIACINLEKKKRKKNLERSLLIST